MVPKTCSIPECDNPKLSRGWCRMHYKRWAAHGNPLTTHAIKKINGGPCKEVGCEKIAATMEWCAMHYTRFRATGDPAKTPSGRYVRTGAERTCSAPGCDLPFFSIKWCSSHHTQYRTGREIGDFQYTWAKEKRCLVCGATEWEGIGRKSCSPRCTQLLSQNGGAAPDATSECKRCGVEFSLMKLGESGRKKRSDSFMCDHCRAARYTRHKMSASQLAVRDGFDCTICGDPVDMELRHPEMFRASVDHVIPYSLGGSHDPENLALAHLWCNQVKHNRQGFTLKAA